MNTFQQRSSWPSSFLTGLIGWMGLFLGPLIFGFKESVNFLFILAIISATVHVLFLRLAFFILKMNKHIFVGAFWGLMSAVMMYWITVQFCPNIRDHQLAWLLTYANIGLPIGGFLSYFYIDDRELLTATGKKRDHYGRDAHWLEPFAYGAIGYLVAFFPFSNLNLTINVLIVGALIGVSSAGLSHFTGDHWKKSLVTLFLAVVLIGTIQGCVSGWLFRVYADILPFSPILHGIVGGILTDLITFLRGRQLALKEKGKL